MSSKLDADSVAALIFTPDGRYLLQRRENVPGISFPDTWGLFGGACDPGEAAKAAMERELVEELCFRPASMREVLVSTFDDRFDRHMRSRRRYYEMEIDPGEVSRLRLGEGADMALFTVEQIGSLGVRAIPFDVCAVLLHVRHRAVLPVSVR